MQKCVCPHANVPRTRYFLQEDNYNAYYDFRMKDYLQRTRIIKTYEIRYWDLYDACEDDPNWAKKEEGDNDVEQQEPDPEPAPAATVRAGAAAKKTGDEYVFDSDEDCFVKTNSVRVSLWQTACVPM